MRIGIISDIHGNDHALEAVLADLAKKNIDRTICLGDVINPLPGSMKVYARLLELQIPMLFGNHEAYILGCLDQPDHPIDPTPNFEPVRALARRMPASLAQELRRLPMTMTVQDAAAGTCLLVHASPLNNRLGYRYGIDSDMEQQLAKIKQIGANTVVCGHWHDPETRDWQGLQLTTAGSVGVPLTGSTEAEYLILEAGDGRWRTEHHKIAYDAESTLKDYRDSGLILEGGPIAWLFYEEIRTGQKCLSTFFKWSKEKGRSYATFPTLTQSAQEFLIEHGTWHLLEPIAQSWIRSQLNQ